MKAIVLRPGPKNPMRARSPVYAIPIDENGNLKPYPQTDMTNGIIWRLYEGDRIEIIDNERLKH
jgi:hypothetical protein